MSRTITKVAGIHCHVSPDSSQQFRFPAPALRLCGHLLTYTMIRKCMCCKAENVIMNDSSCSKNCACTLWKASYYSSVYTVHSARQLTHCDSLSPEKPSVGIDFTRLHRKGLDDVKCHEPTPGLLRTSVLPRYLLRRLVPLQPGMLGRKVMQGLLQHRTEHTHVPEYSPAANIKNVAVLRKPYITKVPYRQRSASTSSGDNALSPSFAPHLGGHSDHLVASPLCAPSIETTTLHYCLRLLDMRFVWSSAGYTKINT